MAAVFWYIFYLYAFKHKYLITWNKHLHNPKQDNTLYGSM